MICKGDGTNSTKTEGLEVKKNQQLTSIVKLVGPILYPNFPLKFLYVDGMKKKGRIPDNCSELTLRNKFYDAKPKGILMTIIFLAVVTFLS